MWVCVVFICLFQAEDGIRDATVTGVQTCALPISVGNRMRLAANSFQHAMNVKMMADRKSVVEGKRVDLGGRRILKKKKKESERGTRYQEAHDKRTDTHTVGWSGG